MENEIIRLIEKDNLKEAIELKIRPSFNFVKKTYYLNQAARLARIENDKNLGVLSYDEYLKERNRIRVSILNEPFFVQIFSIKNILSIAAILGLVFILWTIFDEPKLLSTTINTRTKVVIIQHESSFFANTWFDLANSGFFFWMKKRYIKIGSSKPQLIIQPTFNLSLIQKENQEKLKIKIFKGSNEDFILEEKTFHFNN